MSSSRVHRAPPHPKATDVPRAPARRAPNTRRYVACGSRGDPKIRAFAKSRDTETALCGQTTSGKARSPNIVYIDKTLFQKAGAKTPEEHEKAGTWTWDTFREVAKQTTTGTGGEHTFGFDGAQQPVNLQFYTCVPIWENGAEIINKEEEEKE